MTNTGTWRLLFETLQYRLLGPLRLGTVSQRSEYRDITESALADAAAVLRAVDLTGRGDSDVIWRYWSGLFSGGPPRAGSEETWNWLEEAHAQATAALLASYLHVAVHESTPPEVANRAVHAGLQRIDLLGDVHQFINRIGAMTASEDAGIGAKLWNIWTREEMPEMQAVIIESLPAGLHRLLVFWTLIRGPGQVLAGPEWARTVQEREISQVTRELTHQLEAAGLPVQATMEGVVDQFKGMRTEAEQRYASWLDQRPLSNERIASFRTAVADAWVESRELPTVLQNIGSRTTRDTTEFAAVPLKAPRELFVENTNMIGEDWLGADLGRQLASLEAASAFRYWANLAQRAPANWTIDALLEAFEQRQVGDVQRGVLLLPYDWPLNEWANLNRARLAGFGIRIVTSTSISDEDALLVSAGDETWRIGEDNDVDIDLEPIELEPGADQALVLVTLKCPRPVASGSPICWAVSTRQLIGDEAQRTNDLE